MSRLALLVLPLLAACTTQPSPVVLNELVASNVSGLQDDQGGTPDWIELVNTSEEEVSLDGWFISDDPDKPQRHALDGLTVPAQGYLLLMSTDAPVQEGAVLSFRLSADGEAVVLSNPEGVVDSIAFGAQRPDTALARSPDATGDWTEAVPTPGGANQ